jgi:glyoxylase-like metal-dependent hydrolase (beta-lactamase superfamily II)/8-oxo-dGTP pyrophosphatase MutT (NUDIX family)
LKTFFNPQLENLIPLPAAPKDAAAVVLLRDPEDPKIFWVQRARRVRFMAGYHAFPGGQADLEDALVPVANCDDPDRARMIACAAREIFEETGVLIVRDDARLTGENRARWRRELASDVLTFNQLLAREELVIDARDFMSAPRWVTPSSSPRRFNTRFFAAWLPQGQETEVIPGELELGEWIRPRDALLRWENGECLIATPILRIVEEMSVGIEDFAARLDVESQESRDLHARIEMRKGFFLCPLRTPTIPPATHTNCYLIGGDELIIIDPGSPYPEEQEKLDLLLDALLAEGRRLCEIVITHLHPDHIGGINHLAAKYSLPVAAHRLTAEAIADEVKVDRLIEDDELIELGGPPYWRLRALWTPGHARGHLSFYEERTGTLLTGDLVVGFGTVVIAPPEGHLGDYLASLRRLLALPRLTALLPGHGPILAEARPKLEEYLQHRLEREEQILKLLAEGPRSIAELVETIYVDVPAALHPLAAATVTAHLQKLEEEGRVSRREGKYQVGGE